ncbi:MAG: hypothetical protein H6648_02615 [Caldilineae bacterium]|nr:hypothetical protein [Chloroflexota bacterium]MCB9176025.1 hypothetical protein [Caldilineae bacterium]
MESARVVDVGSGAAIAFGTGGAVEPVDAVDAVDLDATVGLIDLILLAVLVSVVVALELADVLTVGIRFLLAGLVTVVGFLAIAWLVTVVGFLAIAWLVTVVERVRVIPLAIVGFLRVFGDRVDRQGGARAHRSLPDALAGLSVGGGRAEHGIAADDDAQDEHGGAGQVSAVGLELLEHGNCSLMG